MKKLIVLFFAFSCFQSLNAQNIVIDADKLLDFYQTQRYVDAAKYLQAIYPEDTQDVKALNQIAYCYLMSGQLPAAEKNYLKINNIQPNSLPVLFSLVNINSRRGNNLKAKAYLENIIKLDRPNFNAYKQLAGFTDSVALKVTYLKKANELNTADADVAYDLALQYSNLKLYEPAYQVLKSAIAVDTSNFILQKAQLPIANALKKYNEVISIGEKILQNDGDANVIRDVGRAYFALKNYEKCITLYKLLEDLDLQSESLLYYLSISYRELKNYEMATTYAKKTIEKGISRNTALYYSLLGGIYEERNHNISATNAYKKGLTFGEYNTIYYRLGLLYDFKFKQPKIALKYYKQYIKSNPDANEKAQIEYSKTRIAEIN